MHKSTSNQKRISSRWVRRHSPSQALLEFALALPILLLVIFAIVEFALLFQAWLSVENVARQTIRYAVTGQYDPAYCNVDLNGDGSFCSTPAEEDDARLQSIHAVGNGWAIGIFSDAGSLLESQIGFFKVTVCSSADRNGDGVADDLTILPKSGSDGHYAACLKADGSSTEDAGMPGGAVVVMVDFNHPYITPAFRDVFSMAHLSSYREGIVEKFRVSRAIDVPPQLNLPTNTASNTPLPTATFTPSMTPTVTNTATATNTPTITPTPTNTFTPTITYTPTNTRTPTITRTPANTFTPTITRTPTNTFTPTITYTPTWTPACNLTGAIFTTDLNGDPQNVNGYDCPYGCIRSPYLSSNDLPPGQYFWKVETVSHPRRQVNDGSFFLNFGQKVGPPSGVIVPLGRNMYNVPPNYFPGEFKVTVWQSGDQGCNSKTDNFKIQYPVPSPTPTPKPTNTPIVTRTFTPTNTPIVTRTFTPLPKPTNTPIITKTFTPSPTICFDGC